jgi:hypothetical protein
MKTFAALTMMLAAQTAQAEGSAMQAHGSFEIKLSPQTAADTQPWGRMRIDKVFHGGLEGSSIGEMLAVRSAVKGSAGYVALEQVTATLKGRKGSFFLQHSGTMDKGAATLVVSVVPDSATGELQGLQGTMTIEAEGGTHRYVFTYRF